MASVVDLHGGAATRGGVGLRCIGVVHLYRTVEGHDVVALRGVDLDVGPGEQIAFLGPSGSGKSTLLTLFGGIQRPSAGRILLDGHDIARLSEAELAALRSRRVGSLLQGAARNLLMYASAAQNIEFARRAVTREERRDLVPAATLLSLLGLDDIGDRPVRELSGGQRQRAALAATVACGPGLLLAVEPTSQLSHEDRDRMLELVDRIGEWSGTTVLVVTHDPQVAAHFPRTVTIHGGRVGAEGRHGDEYVVVGADGLLHLPGRFAQEWPPGTLVRVESDGADLRLSRAGEGMEDPAWDPTS